MMCKESALATFWMTSSKLPQGAVTPCRCTHTPFDVASLVAAGGTSVREALRCQQGLVRTHAAPRQVEPVYRQVCVCRASIFLY